MSRAKVVVATLLAALASSVVLAATAGTAGAAVQNMVIPAGHFAVVGLTQSQFGPACAADSLEWGYVLDSKFSQFFARAFKGFPGCAGAGPAFAIGPFPTNTSVRVWLADFTIGPQCPSTCIFYSNSTTHTAMTGLGTSINPWIVSMRDSVFGLCGPTCDIASTFPPLIPGNLTVSVYIV
jgi:hypothetical protein